MESEGWKKDETPYLIFTCLKCNQFIYVKTTQKTKKCLRCGRQHKVSSIINSGETVNGMTDAVEMVKTRQNELAIKELGKVPEFRAVDDFTVRTQLKKSIEFETFNDEDEDDSGKFEKMLQEISGSYTEFPYYVFEIMADIYDISNSELTALVTTYQKKGILACKNNLYKVQT
ncbi:MAG: DUF1922 domain-containing protein, partial [Promethearchaeota archaeon]